MKKIEENSRYELIISDWDNGYVNGYEILQRVRKTPITKTVPFVIITERRDKESVLACIHASVSGFIMKPALSQTIDENTIEEKLRPFLEKVSSRNEGITIL
ncbi:MAG: response regulator [Nitrospirae bacterium]|nr:response regulator [Nitrospirota bacterium]